MPARAALISRRREVETLLWSGLRHSVSSRDVPGFAGDARNLRPVPQLGSGRGATARVAAICRSAGAATALR